MYKTEKGRVERITGLDAIIDFLRKVVFFTSPANAEAVNELEQKLDICLTIGKTLSSLPQAGAMAVLENLKEIAIDQEATVLSVEEQEQNVERLAREWKEAVARCQEQYPVTLFIPGVLLFRLQQILAHWDPNHGQARSMMRDISHIAAMVPGVPDKINESSMLSRAHKGVQDRLLRIGEFLQNRRQDFPRPEAKGLHEVLCPTRFDALHAALAPFASNRSVPSGCMLFCHSSTSEEDLTRFFRRVDQFPNLPFVLVSDIICLLLAVLPLSLQILFQLEPTALSPEVLAAYQRLITNDPVEGCLTVISCEQSRGGEQQAYSRDKNSTFELLTQTATHTVCFTGGVGTGKTWKLQAYLKQKGIATTAKIYFPILEDFTCDTGILKLLQSEMFISAATGQSTKRVALIIRVSPCIEPKTHAEVELFLFKLLILKELHRTNSSAILRISDSAQLLVAIEVPPMEPYLYHNETKEDDLERKDAEDQYHTLRSVGMVSTTLARTFMFFPQPSL